MFKIQALAGPLLAALAIGALAQSQPPVGKTREQVKAELAEAQRTGDIVWGETGLKLNEIYPDRYPKKAMPPSETRAEVKAELVQAIKDGDLPMGDLDQTDRELMPDRYPPKPMPPGLTREEVKAETLQAIRAGDVQIGDSGKTLAEEYPERYAGAPAKPPKLVLHRRAKGASAAASAPVTNR
jgi:hypothetical protein